MNAAADAALQRTRAWIAAEPAIAAALAGIDVPHVFGAALLARLVADGRDADAAALADTPFDRPAQGACTREAWPLAQRRGWRPIALEFGALGAELVWCAGDTPDVLPFHEHAAMRLRYRPFNRWFAVRTPLTPAFVATLEAEALPLAGLVYHLSRCGSTLVAQALKAWPGTRVISEPAELDTALTMAIGGIDPDWLAFRGTLAALSQPAGMDARVIVKLDAWHALAIASLRARLPQVPWLFAYRDPLEVLVSHVRASGRHTVPGMLPDAWLEPTQAAAPTLIEHAARVLGSICAAILPHARDGLLVEYGDLAGAQAHRVVATRIAPWFGLDPAAADAQRLVATFATHAKQPGTDYADDRAGKRAAATAELRATAARIAPHYAALEAVRTR